MTEKKDDKTSKGFSLSVGTRRIIAYIILVLLTILCLFWFYVLFVNATRSKAQLNHGFTLIPSHYAAKNLYNLFHNSNLPILRGLMNSFIVAICTSAVSTYFSAMTAYAIHAYDFKFKKAAFTFIMKQYMEANLPMELLESARIDGASELRTFNQIALPMMKPAIAVQAIFSFVTSWNNYFVPALVLKSDSKKTLPILIATLRSADFLKFDMAQVYMFIFMAILPVIIVYLFMARSIVAGLTAGAVKG